MAKRSNPYTEDFIQQSKMHIGLKQFNNNEDRLKQVYEKTLELLFRGAKKPQQELLQNSNNNITTGSKDRMKQLFIGKNCTLLRSGIKGINKNLVEQLCACSGLRADNCGYCETALCTQCQHHCEICQQAYCTKCSLIGSEGTEVCVSCYS